MNIKTKKIANSDERHKKIKTYINELQIIVSLRYLLLVVYADNIHSVSIMIIDVCIESRRVDDSQSGE